MMSSSRSSLLFALLLVLLFGHTSNATTHPNANKDPYKVLGLESTTATQQEIRSSYKKLCLKYHPDKNGDKSIQQQRRYTELFKQVQAANDLIGTVQSRKEYDLKKKKTKSRSNTNNPQPSPPPPKPPRPPPPPPRPRPRQREEEGLYQRNPNFDMNRGSGSSSSSRPNRHQSSSTSSSRQQRPFSSNSYFESFRSQEAPFRSTSAFRSTTTGSTTNPFFSPNKNNEQQSRFSVPRSRSRSSSIKRWWSETGSSFTSTYVQHVEVPLQDLYRGRKNMIFHFNNDTESSTTGKQQQNHTTAGTATSTTSNNKYQAAFRGGLAYLLILKSFIWASPLILLGGEDFPWIIAWILSAIIIFHMLVPPYPPKEEIPPFMADIIPGYKAGTKITFRLPPPGRLQFIFVLEEQPHDNFVREGNKLHTTVTITYWRAKKGGTIKIETLDPSHKIKVKLQPNQIQNSSDTMIVKQHGWPSLLLGGEQQQQQQRGDLILHFKLVKRMKRRWFFFSFFRSWWKRRRRKGKED